MALKVFRVFVLVMYMASSLGWADATTVTAKLATNPTQPVIDTTKPEANNLSNYSEVPFVRIKDLAHFSSVRENPLVGYGLVVGLNGTGDTMSRSTFTRESLTGMLERLGVNIRDDAVPSGKNVAAVMVTASLPAFAQPGAHLDITVSALGDAKELRGGTLLVTPLLGADGNVYAVGQGAVLASGVQVSGKNSKEVRGVPTCARVMNGAIVERGMEFRLTSLKDLNLTLHNPDFTTAQRVASAINAKWPGLAIATDASNIRIQVPSPQIADLVSFMTQIEQVTVQPDLAARVIIDANNDVVTLTSMAKVFPVALTHGSITIKVVETPQVYMPPANANPAANAALLQNINATQGAAKAANNQSVITPLLASLVEQHSKEREALSAKQKIEATEAKAEKSTYSATTQAQLDAKHQAQMATLQQSQSEALAKVIASAGSPPSAGNQNILNGINNLAQPVVVDKTDVKLTEATGKFAIIHSGADLQEFVNALNALGATPRDMMAILQNIKAAGALQADIVLT